MRYLGLGRVTALGFASLALPTAATAQPYAYVANLGADDVSVIDTQTDTVVATLSAGNDPDGAAASADGSRVYITNFASGDVTVIDTATHRVIGTIPVGDGPVGVAVTGDGTRAFVANRQGGSVAIVDTAALAVVEMIAVGGGPNAVAISSDDRRVFVTNSFTRFPGRLTVIDRLAQPSATTEIDSVSSVEVLRNPNRVAVTADGRHTLVTNFRSWNVSVIDTASTQPLTAIRIAGRPSGVAVNPNGAFAYVSTLDGNVVVIDTTTLLVHDAIRVGAEPYGLAINRRGDRGYVANFADDSVSILDLAQHTVLGEVAVGERPFAVAIDCAGSTCGEVPATPLPTTPRAATPTPHIPTQLPTSTPRPTATRRPPTATPVPMGTITASGASAAPGATIKVDFRLDAARSDIAAAENVIVLDRGLTFVQPNACRVNPNIRKEGLFGYLVYVDRPCSDCPQAKAIVIDFEALRSIPSGSVLYSCTVAVSPQASPGNYQIHVVEAAAGNAAGDSIALSGASGTIRVAARAATNGGVTPAGLCSGSGEVCSDDRQCAPEACLLAAGVCAAGEDDGLLCDCPRGTCSEGVCSGGLRAGSACGDNGNCAGGAACESATRLCAHGIAKGNPCLDDRHCAGAPCGVATQRCDGGDFDHFACVDDGDCPFGRCGGFAPTASPTQPVPPTLRPTRTPIETESRTRKPTASPLPSGTPTAAATPSAEPTLSPAPPTSTRTATEPDTAEHSQRRHHRVAHRDADSRPDPQRFRRRRVCPRCAAHRQRLPTPVASRAPARAPAQAGNGNHSLKLSREAVGSQRFGPTERCDDE